MSGHPANLNPARHLPPMVPGPKLLSYYLLKNTQKTIALIRTNVLFLFFFGGGGGGGGVLKQIVESRQGERLLL